VTGAVRPPRGGIRHPHLHGPQRRPWSWCPQRVRRRLPSGYRWRCLRAPAEAALEEEEAGLLQLEVSSVFPHAPLISRGWRSSLSLSRRQGDADRSRPRACEGAQVRNAHDDEAVFREGAADGDMRGGEGCATA
jgi:hypothetical protein